MDKKTIAILILVSIGAFGLMILGSRGGQASDPTESELKTKSNLTAEETFYDFGTISMANGKVKKDFKISNNTAGDIVLESVTTSCMCTSAFVLNGNSKVGPFGMPGMAYVPKVNDTVKAGESREIEVVYDPAAHGPAGVGKIDRFVYLTDSSGGSVSLEINADVTP